MHSTAPARVALLLASLVPVLLFAAPSSGIAQAEWGVEGELGASLFFGNTSQTTLNTRLATERADSSYELSAIASFNYGEAENDVGEEFVVKRSWEVEGSFDWRPYGRWSPFLFGQGQSSLERRIDFRYNAGGGAKYTFTRDEEDRLDLSLALLAEQTFARDEAGVDADESVLARWSARLRYRQSISDGDVTFSTQNFYRPVFGDYGDYVVESRSSFSYALSEIVTLRLSFLDTYDSRAEDRGAETNNDGQLLFSVLASF